MSAVYSVPRHTSTVHESKGEQTECPQLRLRVSNTDTIIPSPESPKRGSRSCMRLKRVPPWLLSCTTGEKARGALHVFEAGEMSVPVELRRRILACTNVEQLSRWLRLAVKAPPVEELVAL
jgi:hypothetical protein